MIQKESYGINTFAAVLQGAEVQEGNNAKDWYCTGRELNVADLLTSGVKQTNQHKQQIAKGTRLP